MNIINSIFEFGSHWSTQSYLVYLLIGIVYAACLYFAKQVNNLNKKCSTNFMHVIAILWLTFFIGFRDTSVGADTKAYVNMFLQATSLDIDWAAAVTFRTQIEPFYQFFEYVIRHFTDNITVFFLIYALIVSTSLTLFFKEFGRGEVSVVPIIAISNYIVFSMSIMRSSLAMCLVMAALIAARKKKRVLPVVLSVLAVYTHNTMIVFLPLFVLLSVFKKINNFSAKPLIALTIIGIAAINISGNYILGIIADTKYSIYEGVNTINIMSIWNVILLTVFLMFSIKNIIKIKECQIILVAFFYELALSPLLMATGFWRLTDYLIPVRLIIWGILLQNISNNLQSESAKVLLKMIAMVGFILDTLFYLGRSSLYNGFEYSIVLF